MFYFVLHAVYLLHCFGTHLLCFYRSQQAGTDLSYVSGVCCVRGTSRHGQDSDVSRITTRKSNTEVRRRHQCIEIRNIYLIQYLKMRSGLLFRQTTNGQDCCTRNTGSSRVSSLFTSASGTTFQGLIRVVTSDRTCKARVM